MKKGICFQYQNGIPIKEQFERYRQAGFDGIELTLSRGYMEVDTGLSEVKKLRDFAEEVGLEIPSLRGGPNLCWKYPVTHPDKQLRENAVEGFKKALMITKILGGKAVLMVPGVVTPEVNYQAAYERAKDAILRIAEAAEKEEIFLAIENVENKFLLSPFEMRDFIDEIKSEYVGSYLDVGNVLCCQVGYPEQWIKILARRIKRVHLKDCQPGRGITYLLQGQVNWPKVVQSLREIGYDDYLIAELPLYRFYPERMLAETAQNIGRIIRGN